MYIGVAKLLKLYSNRQSSKKITNWLHRNFHLAVTAGIELARDLKNRNLENFLLDLEHPETNLKGENPQESNLKSLSPLRYESMNILYLQESMTTC